MTGDSCFPIFLREVRNGHQTTDDVPINPGFWVARFTCSSAVSTPGLCSPKNVFSFQSHRVSDKEPSEGILARRLQFVNFNSNTTWSLKTLEYLKIKKKRFFLLAYYVVCV